MFIGHKTRVVRVCGCWKVERLRLGHWEAMPSYFRTRTEARKHQTYWSRA